MVDQPVISLHAYQRPVPSGRRRARRRGASIIIVIAVFAVTMAVSGFWALRIAQNFRQQRLREEQVQVRWLSDAAIQRAVAALQRDADYAGETWRLDASAFGRNLGAEVEISVTRLETPNAGSRQQIVAIASYPSGSNRRVQTTKTVTYAPAGSELQTFLE